MYKIESISLLAHSLSEALAFMRNADRAYIHASFNAVVERDHAQYYDGVFTAGVRISLPAARKMLRDMFKYSRHDKFTEPCGLKMTASYYENHPKWNDKKAAYDAPTVDKTIWIG